MGPDNCAFEDFFDGLKAVFCQVRAGAFDVARGEAAETARVAETLAVEALSGIGRSVAFNSDGDVEK